MNHNIAKEIMVTKVVTLRPDMHVYDGIARLLKSDFTGAPVVAPDQTYLGVFSERCCMSILQALATSAQVDPPKWLSSPPRARDFMVSKLTTLSPDMDVFDAIEMLLKNRISGAPVLGADGEFLGVFSEKNSMQVLISAAYEQLPTARVDAFMNRDLGRVISPDADLFNVAELFQKTHFRRLEVLDKDRLLGQISRRDVLKVQGGLSADVRHRIVDLKDEIMAAQGAFQKDDVEFSPNISYFMDREAKTITEDVGLLDVARIFLDTPYRRLPILKNQKVVGQISRRDVLKAAHQMLAFEQPKPKREKSLLYLSSLLSREDSPFA